VDSRKGPAAETPRRPRVKDPELPDEVSIGQLDREVRAQLRGLSKEHAERVGRHLVMAGSMLDIDPELAYQHSQAAVRHASRIDVVREAAGICAYHTGRYAEALSELRTARRLSGSSAHLAIMADAERGLGRPEKALELANSPEAEKLKGEQLVEFAMVQSGARCDLGQFDAALSELNRLPAQTGELRLRVLAAKASVLEQAGRSAEAERLLAGINPADLERATGYDDSDVVVFDTEEPEDDPGDGIAGSGGDVRGRNNSSDRWDYGGREKATLAGRGAARGPSR
jgi:tetratricopeptide (TPR) repeat protein